MASVLALCAWILARRSAPFWAHAIWLLALVRLLTPPLVSLPWPASWPTVSPSIAQPLLVALVGIWIAGSISLAGFIVWRGLSFERLLRRAGRHCSEAQGSVEQLSVRIGLRRQPQILLLDVRTTPLVWGVGPATTIVFPTDLWRESGAPARQAMLLHELTHVRRGDHWVRALEALALIGWWWLPVVWIARRAIAECEESCCDACALQSFHGPRRHYAEALLTALEFASDRFEAPSLATGIRPAQELTRRLKDVMQRTRPTTLTLRQRSAIVLTAALLLPLDVRPSAGPGNSSDTPSATQAAPAGSATATTGES